MPNIYKLIRKEDVNGLIKVLKNKNKDIRKAAAEALDKIGWKPSNNIPQFDTAFFFTFHY